MTGFVNNENLIQENHKTKDLFDFSSYIEYFRDFLDKITQPSTIALVGPFGSGKSTMLNQIKELNPEEELWIEFDAWKYPDRKDLWEGFVLDFADQVGKRGDLTKILDGKNQELKVASTLINGFTAGLVGNLLEDIFEKTPATRVFEIQEILTTLIKGQKKKIFIIVEDIDRSGDGGIFFLETLKQFLRNLEKNDGPTVLAIAPIGNESYEDEKTKNSYLKCLDHVCFFKLKKKSFDEFIKNIFDDKLLKDNHLTQLSSFFEGLFASYPGEMTIRKLKMILRGANSRYQMQQKDGQNPDYRLSILFEAAKHCKEPNSILYKTYFDIWRKNRVISGTGVLSGFLECLRSNGTSVLNKDGGGRNFLTLKCTLEFIQKEKQGSGALFYNNANSVHGEVCDFYLEYE